MEPALKIGSGGVLRLGILHRGLPIARPRERLHPLISMGGAAPKERSPKPNHSGGTQPILLSSAGVSCCNLFRAATSSAKTLDAGPDDPGGIV